MRVLASPTFSNAFLQISGSKVTSFENVLYFLPRTQDLPASTQAVDFIKIDPPMQPIITTFQNLNHRWTQINTDNLLIINML